MNITKAYIRHYRDNGQITAYVEWFDGSRTEGTYKQSPRAGRPRFIGPADFGPHMSELLRRALINGLTIERQTW